MNAAQEAKEAVGRAAAELVTSGMQLGFGSGSTFLCFLEALAARRARETLDVVGVPSSSESAEAATRLGVPLIELDTVDPEVGLDLTIDGADEIDPSKAMIKGGGAALVRERLVAVAAREMIVLIHEDKQVATLGAFPLPVEILPFGAQHTIARLSKLSCTTQLRSKKSEPVVTDNHNWIVDCAFSAISDPGALQAALNQIPGVVDCGLFVGLAGRVLMAPADHGPVRTYS